MDEDLVLVLYLLLPLVSGGALALFWRTNAGQGAKATWPRLLLGNVLVFLCLLFLLCLAGEMYYRFIHDTTDGLAINKVSVRWFERHYHLNSWGCRDDINYESRIAPGKRRVTFLGDSFTTGHGVKDVADVFAARIRRLHPEWEVHIIARLGFDTGKEMDSISQCLGNNYQLDEVVLAYCLNDTCDLLPAATNAILRIHGEIEGSGWLRQNSYLVDTVYNRLNLWRNPDLKTYYQLMLDGYRDPLWARQEERLKALRDLVQSHGGRLSVVTLPLFQVLGPHYPYQFIHDKLDLCWRRLKVPHLDLLPVYKGLAASKLTVSRFDGHPNERAHALAVPPIDEFLRAQMAGSPSGNSNAIPAP